jgi:hypothetical protein
MHMYSGQLQNKCLRRTTGAYRRTPRAALEREAAVPPLDVYIDTTAMQRAATVQSHPVEEKIRQTLERIRGTRHTRRARAPRRRGTPKHVSQEALCLRAAEREKEMRELLAHQAETRRHTGRAPQRRQRIGGHQHRWRSTTLIARWADLEWKRRWKEAAKAQDAATWNTPWSTPTLPLYEGLTKAESTAAFLLRTEVLGLNAWLASIHVPNTTPQCTCGWPTQSVRHILLFCSHRSARDQLLASAGTNDITQMLSTSRGLQAAAKWLIGQGILQQFQTAHEIQQEDTTGYAPLQPLRDWSPPA